MVFLNEPHDEIFSGPKFDLLYPIWPLLFHPFFVPFAYSVLRRRGFFLRIGGAS